LLEIDKSGVQDDYKNKKTQTENITLWKLLFKLQILPLAGSFLFKKGYQPSMS
jgi:hypothetical protein